MPNFDFLIGNVNANSASGRFLLWAKDLWNAELDRLVDMDDGGVLRMKLPNIEYVDRCVGIIAATFVRKVLDTDTACKALLPWRQPIIDPRTESVTAYRTGYQTAYVRSIIGGGVSAEHLDSARNAYMSMIKNAAPEPFDEDDLATLPEWQEAKMQVILSQDKRVGAW